MLDTGRMPVKLSTRQETPADAPAVEQPARQVALAARTDHVGPGTAAPARRTPETGGGNAAVQRLATRPGAHAAHLGLLSAGGGRALQRLHTRGVQPKLTISQPGDRFEVQAEAVAERIGQGEAPAGPAPAISRMPAPAAAAGTDEVPPGLAALLADPGPGSPIPDGVRTQIEQHLGADLSNVQVHTSARAQEAAAQLRARAFTSGAHIFLGAGESAADLPLMAHEATHVVQQQAVSVYRAAIQRESDSWLPDFVIDEVREFANDIPGYTMLTVVAGYDPIANRNVDRSPANLVRGVLGLIPFGNEIATRLLDMGILQEAFRILDQGLTAHDLTLARIQREIDQVWDELSISNGISGNIAVIERHVVGLYRDAMAFVRGVVEEVLRLIREAAVGLASRLLAGRPVWELTKKVLHQDPLTGERVDAPTVEILADFLTLIGKQDTLAQMQERGTLQQTADWLDQQLGRFGSLVGELMALFEAAWNAIQPANIASLPDNLGKLAGDAVGLVQRVGAFAADIMVTVLKLVKDSLLGWLSTKAHDMRGFRLLTVIIGTNPFTGADVPRTAEALIGGFVALLPGGEETYRKLAEAGVIAEAGAQIEAAITSLGISPGMIIETFVGIWKSFTLQDLLNPIGAIMRVLEMFGEPLLRIIAFVGEVIKVVVMLILKLMNFPSELLGSILSNVVAAIEDIKRDPVGFIINMLQALKTGLFAFLDKVLTYLLSGLADWLFRGLGTMGIQKPADLSFGSILTMVLQVLDITADKLWAKLGKKIGDDVVAKIRAGLEMADDAFDFVKDVQENGVAAIWKHVESQLGNLWDTLLGMAQQWIVTEIVEKATAKLLSMLDPTGIMAVVNSTIAFFKAVQSVIDYIREILQIVNDYVSTLAAIAAGNIAVGAQKVEKGLADAVPVAIGFLANQAGLGNVPEKLVELIGQLRELVDKALDWLFDKAMQLGKAALGALGLGGPAEPAPAGATPAGEPIVPTGKSTFAMDGTGHTMWFEQVGGKYQVFMASSPGWLKGRIDQALQKNKNLPADAAKGLGDMATSLGGLEAEIAESEPLYKNTRQLNSKFFGQEGLTQAEYRQKVTQKVSEWRTLLETIGNLYNLTDLQDLGHPSRYVEGDSIAQTYRAYPLWRDTFYEDWAPGVRDRAWRKDRAEGLAHWQSLNPGATIPSDFDLYRCKECNTFYSARGAVPGFEVRAWSLDHMTTVASHFQQYGLSLIHSDRTTWYNLDTNLQGLCKPCNHDSDRMSDWRVGMAFRGPGE
jgi:hypothetical protein